MEKDKTPNEKSVVTEENDSYAMTYCSLPMVAPPQLPPDLDSDREELIIMQLKKWVNGTTLRYYFFDEETDGRNVQLPTGQTVFRPWKTSNAEKDIVRHAFDVWKNVGIGINFKEVSSRNQAEIRIGFERKDGAWSFIGRDLVDLHLGPNKRTMNFGWDLTRSAREIDTAVHEIGHSIGFPHEHQNPIAGIVWDEEAVYDSLAKPPNEWSRDKTFFNIIRKISPDSVQGSEWDPNSIMHYPFEAGLIKQPDQYQDGLTPAGGLSARDKTWVKTFYPPISMNAFPILNLNESTALSISAGGQKNFSITPTESREYEFQTSGVSDTVMVLFEKVGSEEQFLAGDDDSGEDRNAYLKAGLTSGKEYVLRIRLYYATESNETAVTMR